MFIYTHIISFQLPNSTRTTDTPRQDTPPFLKSYEKMYRIFGLSIPYNLTIKLKIIAEGYDTICS